MIERWNESQIQHEKGKKAFLSEEFCIKYEEINNIFGRKK